MVHLLADFGHDAGQQRLPHKKRKTWQDAQAGPQDTGADDASGSPNKRMRGPEKVKRPIGRPRKHPDLPQAPDDTPAEVTNNSVFDCNLTAS